MSIPTPGQASVTPMVGGERYARGGEVHPPANHPAPLLAECLEVLRALVNGDDVNSILDDLTRRLADRPDVDGAPDPLVVEQMAVAARVEDANDEAMARAWEQARDILERVGPGRVSPVWPHDDACTRDPCTCPPPRAAAEQYNGGRRPGPWWRWM